MRRTSGADGSGDWHGGRPGAAKNKGGPNLAEHPLIADSSWDKSARCPLAIACAAHRDRPVTFAPGYPHTSGSIPARRFDRASPPAVFDCPRDDRSTEQASLFRSEFVEQRHLLDACLVPRRTAGLTAVDHAAPVAERRIGFAHRGRRTGRSAQRLAGLRVLRQHLVVELAGRRRIAGCELEVGQLDTVGGTPALLDQHVEHLARHGATAVALRAVGARRLPRQVAPEPRQRTRAVAVGLVGEPCVEVRLGSGELSLRHPRLEARLERTREEIL